MPRREDQLLVCYRRERRLELWDTSEIDQDPTLVRAYQIAVGMPGYKTDPGVYRINSKSDAPEWRMPDSPWVEPENRGKLVAADDPANPIVARWMGFGSEGEGIHGTRALDSLGTAASHGCIRMAPPAIRELYPLVPMRTVLVIF